MIRPNNINRFLGSNWAILFQTELPVRFIFKTRFVQKVKPCVRNTVKVNSVEAERKSACTE